MICDRQTDSHTEKCVAISGMIACAARTMPPKILQYGNALFLPSRFTGNNGIIHMRSNARVDLL